MKNVMVTGICAISLLCMAGTAFAADAELKTDDEKVFYYLGTRLSENLTPLALSVEEVELIARGMRDALLGSPVELDGAMYDQKLNEIAQERMASGALREEADAREYIQTMAAEEGAMTTDSGIVIREITAGSGAMPTPTSTVTAHYHGTLRDGTVFDSSVARDQPFTSSLDKVIPCWREAIPTIKVGGKSKITCPSELAYGQRGSGAIPGGAALKFEVELIEIVE